MDTNVFHAGVLLAAATSALALGKIRVAYSESIGVPKIPNVSWDDVGGLAHVKSNILDTIQLPLEHPELFADGLKKRSGKHCVIYSFTSFSLTECRYPSIWTTRNW
jgi:peroxin-6